MHANVARGGSVEKDDRLPICVNEDVGSLIVNSGCDPGRCQDDHLDDVADPVSTALAILLCILLLRICFAVVFRFPARVCFELSFYIANSNCTLKGNIDRNGLWVETQYYRKPCEMEKRTLSIEMSFKENPL